MPARRWCLIVALAALVACGNGTEQRARQIGTEVTFTVPVAAGSGQSITLQAIERGSGAKGVVLAHMLGSSQNAWAAFADALVKEGFHVLTFDFRGHGLSGGDRDPSRAGLDLAGAVAKLRSLGASRVLVVGASMGGTAALAVAKSSNVDGVVTLSAPASIDELDAARGARAYKGPLLLIVGQKDDRRYTDAARALLEATGAAPKKLEVVDGTGAHGTDLLSDARAGMKVKTMILAFLDAHGG